MWPVHLKGGCWCVLWCTYTHSWCERSECIDLSHSLIESGSTLFSTNVLAICQPSVFTYSQGSKTGQWEGPGIRLCEMPRMCAQHVPYIGKELHLLLQRDVSAICHMIDHESYLHILMWVPCDNLTSNRNFPPHRQKQPCVENWLYPLLQMHIYLQIINKLTMNLESHQRSTLLLHHT